MNRTNEIELLTNPAYHTMVHNGYIISAIFEGLIGYWKMDETSGCTYVDNSDGNIVFINFNKEYFN